MKKLLFIFLLLSGFASTTLLSQSSTQLHFGGSFGRMSTMNIGLIHQEKFAQLQVELQTNFGEDFILLKGGFRLVEYKGFSWYVFLPPLVGKIGTGYVTPFNTEIFYKKNLSLNVDIYRNTVVPTVKVRLPLDL